MRIQPDRFARRRNDTAVVTKWEIARANWTLAETLSSRLQAIEDSIEIIAGQLAPNLDEKNATDLPSPEKND